MKPEARLFNEAIESFRGDFTAFFERHGCPKVGDGDSKGWITTKSCFTSGALMRVNVETGEWSDPDSKTDGGLFDFLARHMKVGDDAQSKLAVLGQLCAQCGLSDRFDQMQYESKGPVVPEKLIKQWSKAFGGTEKGLSRYEDFYKRTGIALTMVQHYRIGFADANTDGLSRWQWIIPIPDEHGIIRCVRIADETLICRWPVRGEFSGFDRTPKLYGIDEMLREMWTTVIICQSELDRIRIMQERDNNQIGALSLTDMQYLRRFNHLFQNLKVVLCMHNDDDSQHYAKAVIAPMLYEMRLDKRLVSLKSLYLPVHPLTETSVCHWFQAGGNWSDLMNRIAGEGEWTPAATALSEPATTLKHFSDIDDPLNLDHKVQVRLQITGETNTTYDTPAEFAVEYCDWIKSGKCLICEDRTWEIPPGHQAHIGICGLGEKESIRACQNVCCKFGKRPRIDIRSKYAFRQMIASDYRQRIVIDKESKRADERLNTERAIYVRVPEGSPAMPEPRGYLATGWVRTNPSNSQRTLLVESMERIEEGYEQFDLASNLESLKKLRGLGWRGIVEDINAYRTRIYGKEEILLITLLTYCSPLRINFNGQSNIRGWLTSAVIGESGAGKSKSFETVSEMVGSGNMFNCQTGSRTGLTYCILYNGTRWQCHPGMLPRSTKGMLAIEEIQDMPMTEISSMGMAMDTGRLAVERSARGSYETETRLLINGNPPKGATLSTYRFGCQVFKELFPNMVIRRLDLGAVMRKPSNNEVFNRPWKAHEPPKVLPTELQSLIFYAWTLPAERIWIDENTTAGILRAAKGLSDRFGSAEDVPLVCPSDIRFTIARMSAAWAILSLSVTEDFQVVHVKQEHVDLAAGFLANLYSSEDCALDRYCDHFRHLNRLDDYDLIATEFDRQIKSKRLESCEGKNPFIRLLVILRSGRRYTQAELTRILKCTAPQCAQMIDSLNLANLLFNIGDGLQASNKFTRFMDKYERENQAIAGLMALCVDK